MSHPPQGPPPPYYTGHGHPPPPPGGSYAYVPTPVMMPVYQPPPPQPPPEPTQPPTYVTNYIYQQPQQPPPVVTIVEEVHVEPAPPPPNNHWSSLLRERAGKGLATVGKGLAVLENNLRNRNAIDVGKRPDGMSLFPWKMGRPLTWDATCVETLALAHLSSSSCCTGAAAVAAENLKRCKYSNLIDPIDWVPTTTSEVTSLTHRAYVAGNEGWDGSPLCIIRSHHSGEFIPGKLAIKHRSAYVPHGGREIPVHNFEVLCCPSHAVRWLHSSNGQVPAGAIAAGNTHNGEPLYIGRVRHMNSLTPGKVHPSHGCCYISFGGAEVTHKSYEVLCRFVG